MPPEARLTSESVVSAFLARLTRRLRIVDAVRATSAALLASSVVIVFTAFRDGRTSSMWMTVLTVASATAGAMLWRARARWSPDVAASLVERSIPESHNVVFTARELMAAPVASAPWMRRRVVEHAASLVQGADAPAIVPIAPDVLWLVVAAASLASIAFLMPQRLTSLRVEPAGSGRRTDMRGLGALQVSATVTSPAYTGIPVRTLADPDSLEVVQGSRIAIAVKGAGQWLVRFGTRRLPAGESGVEIAPDESGYFAIEREGNEGTRRLVPVTVMPDRAPTVRIEVPGKDLLMPVPRGSIAVASSATDDYGVQSLELRYTKVTGSGEQFEFVEGSLPVSIVRESGRSWKASGHFDLGGLGLKPGDSLVYRAVARDGRPGGGFGASDTFFIEIAGPGQVALPGFELPPDRERYALSQQMIVLKLQRLRAREGSLSRGAVAEETTALAAEQRTVRANFIFLMGGQVENEEAEAEQSSEIQEGRLENSARREINTAIHFMGQAEQALAAVDTAAALPPAKSAVDALQRAFGRNRYFLRTLATRSRLDPSRRLSGDLKEASGWNRSPAPATGEPSGIRARSVLERLLTLASDKGLPPADASAALGALAEEALAVDPGSAEWRRISTALTAVREGLVSGRSPQDVRRAMHDATMPLLAMSRKRDVTAGDSSNLPDSLKSAWSDEARRR